MKIIKVNWKRGAILLLLLVLSIIDVFLYKGIKSQGLRSAMSLGKYNFKNVTSIQYQEIRETNGIGDGRNETATVIYYVYPDKMRIEKGNTTKVIEIYNSNRYIYYNNINNKIKLKECFFPERPYITEVEKRMAEISGNGVYEFFGYEEIQNRRTEVIGIKSKVDGSSYMHKLWLATINDITLPIREEYFINNSAVSKTSFNYLKINEPIDPELFKITSLPNVEAVEDGVIPKYVQSIAEAEEYLKIKVLVPRSEPEGYDITEIAVTPPVENPSFHCLYLKDGNGIYLRQRKGSSIIKSNAALGEFPCEYKVSDEMVSLGWNQKGLHITLTGDDGTEEDIRKIAEEISGGKFVLGKD